MGIIGGEFTRVEFDRWEFSGGVFEGGGGAGGGCPNTCFALFRKGLLLLLLIF